MITWNRCFFDFAWHSEMLKIQKSGSFKFASGSAIELESNDVEHQ